MPEEGPEPAARLLRLPGRTLETLAHVEKQLRHRAAQDNPLEVCLSNRTALAMAFKLVEGAQKTWRRLDGRKPPA
jgi:putative transposase